MARLITRRAKRAKLLRTRHGLKPLGEGWFVLNTAKALWYGHPTFGASTPFEGEPRFSQVGINIHVLGAGQPNCHYHAESDQEDFLVVSGRCKLLVDGRVVKLGPWDFVHCAPWTDHVFVGEGKEPCVLVMTGARSRRGRIRYLRTPLAVKHGASTPRNTPDPRVSYSLVERWTPTSPPAPFRPPSRRPGARTRASR